MTCDRNNPCRTEMDRHADDVAKRLDMEDPNVGQMLLEASGIYRNPQQMESFVANVQRRENTRTGDNLEVAQDGRLLINKLDNRIEILPIDATGARFRTAAGERGPGTYHDKQQAGVGDYVQRGVVGAITGAAINGRNRGQGAIQGAGGAVGGKAVREATGQEGATGAVVEGLGACATGALIGGVTGKGGKDGCKNGAIGSVVGQGLDWLTKKKQ